MILRARLHHTCALPLAPNSKVTQPTWMAASGRWWAAAAAVWTVAGIVVAVAGAPEVWPLPADLVKQMARGINLGNTLDAKYEGALAPPAEEWLFDDYVEKGFKTVRIPVTWGNHTADFPPWVDRPLSRFICTLSSPTLHVGA